MAKRLRRIAAKPGQIVAGWGRESVGDTPDLVYAWGAGSGLKADARVLCWAFEDAKNAAGTTLRDELERRGYDLTTLRFSIERRP